MGNTIKLGMVLPCYNEEAVVKDSFNKLYAYLEKLEKENKISDFLLFFVDDGSQDETWHIIKSMAAENQCVRGIKLSHNSGHQNALIAGLEDASKECDAVITIDVDLQDDIFAIEQMVTEYGEGAEIVYGIRNNRDTDTFFKKKTASLFYKIMNSFNAGTIPNHADFRLMSKRTCEALLSYGERNLFLRGIVPSMGFKSAEVYYSRKLRLQGETKYPLKKMLNFAVEGITSFSIKPIRTVFSLGIIFLILTLSISAYVIISIIMGKSYPGWASLMLSLWFIGSLILIALGIIGEYVGKIYLEIKRRPRYFVEDRT